MMDKYAVPTQVPEDRKCPICGAKLEPSQHDPEILVCPEHGTEGLEPKEDANTGA
jgi:transcription initiation factor IIE alpha subunit